MENTLPTDSQDNSTVVSAKVPTALKAKLLNDAKSHDMTLSQYIAYLLSIEGENQKEVLKLREQQKGASLTENGAILDAVLGISDTLAEMQSKIQEMQTTQVKSLKEELEEQKDQMASAWGSIEEYLKNHGMYDDFVKTFDKSWTISYKENEDIGLVVETLTDFLEETFEH